MTDGWAVVVNIRSSEEDAEGGSSLLGLEGEEVVVARVYQLPGRQSWDEPLRYLIVDRQLIVVQLDPRLTVHYVLPLPIALL